MTKEQAAVFWHCCMESPSAQAIAAYHSLPRSAQNSDTARPVVRFLRLTADALERFVANRSPAAISMELNEHLQGRTA